MLIDAILWEFRKLEERVQALEALTQPKPPVLTTMPKPNTSTITWSVIAHRIPTKGEFYIGKGGIIRYCGTKNYSRRAFKFDILEPSRPVEVDGSYGTLSTPSTSATE